MENILSSLLQFGQRFKKEISVYYERYYEYVKDLFSYKNINIYSKLDVLTGDSSAITMISATNSALNTVGFSYDDLKPDDLLFNEIFVPRKSEFFDLNIFFEREIKPYLNKHLFIILIEFLADIDSAKMNNLDLFDLLPQNFLPLLLRYKRENRVFLDEIAIIKERIFEIDEYFDPTTLTIKPIGLPSKSKKSELSDEDILLKLKSARENTLEVLKKQNGTIPESLRIDIDLEEPPVITDQPSTPKYGKVLKPVFYNLFGNFARINQDVIRKFNINLSNLVNSSRDKMTSIDLEDLFYLVSIFKMIGISSQLETSRVVGVLQNYVSGKIFSTAKYHKPNPINTFYGIAILSELDLLNQSEFIDMLEIEMFLEGEMRNFFPEKLLLNFYTILSLKLLERNGTSLTNKNGLYASLLNLNLLSIERFNPSLDIFCHLTSLKLLNDQADLNKFTIPYMREILKRIDQSNGSVNNCITDTARVLLSLNLLDPMDQEMYLKKQLANFLITGIKYFDDEELENELNWGNDSIAYKLELRMLYWALVAISQNLKLA